MPREHGARTGTAGGPSRAPGAARPVVRVIAGGLASDDVADASGGGGTPIVRAPVEGRTAPRADGSERATSVVEVYQAEHLSLFRFIRAATGDDQVAEDVLQETFLRLLREVAAGRIPGNVHAWLYRVASNVVVSQVRRERTAERHLTDLVSTRLAASPEQYVLEAERDDAVRDAIRTLPLDGRLAILLAAQGFTGHEIAVALGRTDGAARTLLCRSRLRVRERLEPLADSGTGTAG